MASIHMIGVAHDDPIGYETLSSALATENPDVITVETNQTVIDSLEMGWYEERNNIIRKAVEESCLSEKSKKILFDYFVPITVFEYRAAKDFAERNNLDLYFVDDIDSHKKSVENINSNRDKLLEMTRNLTPEELPDVEPALQHYCVITQDMRYGITHRIVNSEVSQPEIDELIEGNSEFYSERDDHMAKEIRRLANKTDGKIVHIGGSLHMLDDVNERTLYSKLSDFNPTRTALDDYTQ